MFSFWKLLSFLLLVSYQSKFSSCNVDDFQTTMDGFMTAFDDVYSTEINSLADEMHDENEVAPEMSALGEGSPSLSEQEEQRTEEPIVSETIFEPGSEVTHELTDEVWALARQALAAISSQLTLLNVTDAASMVTNKVQRSLKLVVLRGGDTVSCNIELINRGSEDEVAWHNCLETNEVPRAKRGAIGGFKQVEDDEAKELAEIALQTLDSIDADDYRRYVKQVIKAQKQLVNGIMYHLTLEVATTDCREDDESCKGKITDVNICKILLQRLFSGDAPHNAQVIKSECTPIAQSTELESKKSHKRVRRGASVDGTESNMIIDHDTTTKKTHSRNLRLMGGKVLQDPNSEKIKELSEFALAQIDKSSNSLIKQKIVRVVNAKSQVVAGMKYFLKMELMETNCRKGSDQVNCDSVTDKELQSCDVVIWEKPWLKYRAITKVACSPLNERKKRGTIPGGLQKADPNDERVQEMARFAVSQLDAQSNSIFTQKLVAVKDAQTQVVAGSNYYLRLQLVETDCRKDSTSTSDCSAAANRVLPECDVVVYDRPWDKHREMTSVNCKHQTTKVTDTKTVAKRDVLVGGHTPQDKDSQEVQDIAHYAVEDLNKKSNAMYKQTLVEVLSAHTQVVAGLKYLLKLKIAESDCKKNNHDLKKCSPKSTEGHQECDVEVWSQPWLNKREVTKMDCHPVQVQAPEVGKSRNKREAPLTGGKTPQDKDSNEIKKVSQFGVEDLNKKSNTIYKQALDEVLSAHKQVVSGINYYLKLRVVETNCKKNSNEKEENCTPTTSGPYQECDMTIWSRPWLNKQEVTKSVCKQTQEKQETRSGEPRLVDISDPEVQEAAKFSLSKIDRASNSMYKHALLKVVDAKVQTVSGKKYFLTVEVGESDCFKGHSQENCAIRADNTLNERCNVVVWDRPWMAKKEVLEVNCGRRDKRATAATTQVVHFQMFEEFKSNFNKTYASESEHNKRFRIFRANLKKIKFFQDNEQGTAIYGPTMFADLTEKEFKRHYTGLKTGPQPRPSRNHMVAAQIPDVELPTDFDWRDHNAVTPVKNQGQCGSCWAFSVTGNIEGQWAIKHGQLLSFSEQELVDCDKQDSGCNGGFMTQAYEAIEQLGGLETEDEYPYDARDETCHFNQSEVAATVVSSVNITTNETQIAQWLFKNGPISIGINANAMQFYMGGVSHPFKFLCSKEQLDHGVLLVGFGVHRTSIRHKLLPYWLVKNSWGPRWGDKGYYRVYRGDGTCGVNQMCSSAVVG